MYCVRDGHSFLVLCSCVPGILGTRARGTTERERIGTLNLRSCEEMTLLWRILRGEVEGGDCGRDTSLTPNRLLASRIVHRVRVTRGVVAQWRVDPAHLIRPYTNSVLVMSCSPTPTHTLRTQNRNTGAQGNAKKMSYRNVGKRNSKEKSRNAKVHRNAHPSLWNRALRQFHQKLVNQCEICKGAIWKTALHR